MFQVYIMPPKVQGQKLWEKSSQSSGEKPGKGLKKDSGGVSSGLHLWQWSEVVPVLCFWRLYVCKLMYPFLLRHFYKENLQRKFKCVLILCFKVLEAAATWFNQAKKYCLAIFEGCLFAFFTVYTHLIVLITAVYIYFHLRIRNH